MEGFIAVRDICSFGEVRELSRRSDARGLVQLGSHLGAIAAAGGMVWLVSGTWWLMIPAQMILGVLITFLFCPLHETVHRTAFATGALNETIGRILGFVVFLPMAWFRHFHFEHHRRTHIEGKDPELAVAKPETRAQLLFYLTGLKSFWWSSLRTLVRHAAGRLDDPFVPEGRARAQCRRQAVIHLAGYLAIAGISILTGSLAAVTFWIAPMVLSAWSLRLYLLAEHTLLPHSADMLNNTRTMRTNALMRWLAWQMPYHVEHHAFPSIPFHNLSRAFDRIAPRHGHLIPGYMAFAREYWMHPDRARAAQRGGES